VPDMRIYQNELTRCTDAIYNLKLRITYLNSTDNLTTKLNAKFPWPPIMPKQRECILGKFIYAKRWMLKTFLQKNLRKLLTSNYCDFNFKMITLINFQKFTIFI
jgi:hypothetical protein